MAAVRSALATKTTYIAPRYRLVAPSGRPVFFDEGRRYEASILRQQLDDLITHRCSFMSGVPCDACERLQNIRAILLQIFI